MMEWDVPCCHSRPRVSHDNPVSESQFKTPKYPPDYPGRFDSMAHARHGGEDCFRCYNFKHHHSGLAGFTPEQVFTGRYKEVAEQKQCTLDTRYQRHPERFVKGHPAVRLPPAFVAINPITAEDGDNLLADHVNFPTFTQWAT